MRVAVAQTYADAGLLDGRALSAVGAVCLRGALLGETNRLRGTDVGALCAEDTLVVVAVRSRVAGGRTVAARGRRTAWLDADIAASLGGSALIARCTGLLCAACVTKFSPAGFLAACALADLACVAVRVGGARAKIVAWDTIAATCDIFAVVVAGAKVPVLAGLEAAFPADAEIRTTLSCVTSAVVARFASSRFDVHRFRLTKTTDTVFARAALCLGCASGRCALTRRRNTLFLSAKVSAGITFGATTLDVAGLGAAVSIGSSDADILWPATIIRLAARLAEVLNDRRVAAIALAARASVARPTITIDLTVAAVLVDQRLEPRQIGVHTHRGGGTVAGGLASADHAALDVGVDPHDFERTVDAVESGAT